MSLPAVLNSARSVLELKVKGGGGSRHQVCMLRHKEKEERRSSDQMSELCNTDYVIRGVWDRAGSMTVCVC